MGVVNKRNKKTTAVKAGPKKKPLPVTEIARRSEHPQHTAIKGDQASGSHFLPKGVLQNIRSKAYVKSRIRPIGNSKGVILSNQLIEAAGLNIEADIVIQAADGVIYIFQLKTPDVNTDLSTWDKQFKTVIKKGAKPESDLFENMANDFDLKEW